MAEPVLKQSEFDEYLRFREQFAALLDPTLYPLAWLDAQVWSGNFRLFTTADSAILTSIKVYPSGLSEIHGEAAVGKLRDLVTILIPYAEQFGRSLGCTFGSIASRPGWERVMQAFGYSHHQTTIRKPL